MKENILENSQNKPLNNLIAKNLKKLRQQHGLSQTALSKLTGIHQVSISRYERSERCICIEQLLLISKALGENPLTLLEGWEKVV